MTNAQANNVARQEVARDRMDQAAARRADCWNDEADWNKAQCSWEAAAVEWQAAVKEGAEARW